MWSSPQTIHGTVAKASYTRRSTLAVPNYMKLVMLIELDALPTGRHSKVDRTAVANMALPNNAHVAQRSTNALTD
jgi:hypothetical protein